MAQRKKKNALKSLYGEGYRLASKKEAELAKTRVRECVAMPGHRKGEIFTPQIFLDALLKFWPDGISLDAASEVSKNGVANVPADDRCDGETKDGLKEKWLPRTFCNPPYGQLKQWMAKSAEEDCEHVLLVPLRTHRLWFRLANYAAVAFLKPLKFREYKQAFPAPLAVLLKLPSAYHRKDDRRFARTEAFLAAFEDLSTQIVQM